MLFVFIIIFFSLISCSKSQKKVSTGLRLGTDETFSEMSLKEGMFNAFLSYIADDGVILRNNSYPDKGKGNLFYLYNLNCFYPPASYFVPAKQIFRIQTERRR